MNEGHAKTAFWWLLNAVLVVVILAGLSAVGAIRANEASRLPARTITVSGDGKTVAIPDIARLSFSVVSEGQNPKTLEEQNTEKINQALEFIKGQGILKDDIKTSQYDLSPRYDYDKFTGQSKIFGYVLTQTVSIKIRKDHFEKIGPILEAIPKQGVNQISSLSFDVDEPDVYLEKAREEAFAKARRKAEVMVGQNGVRLGTVVTFQESSGGYPIPYYAESLRKGGIAADALPTPPQIEPGSQEVTVQVNVTYEIR